MGHQQPRQSPTCSSMAYSPAEPGAQSYEREFQNNKGKSFACHTAQPGKFTTARSCSLQRCCWPFKESGLALEPIKGLKFFGKDLISMGIKFGAIKCSPHSPGKKLYNLAEHRTTGRVFICFRSCTGAARAVTLGSIAW